MIAADESLDAICRGEIELIQRRDGYRFSLDPIFLAGFVGAFAGDGVDLGAGCGILTVLLARRGARSMVGVELQPGLAAIATRNLHHNGVADRAEIHQGDLRELQGKFPPDRFDLVVSNPPYIPGGDGNINPSREKAIARHELNGSLAELVAAASRLLRSGGRLALVLPAFRLDDLWDACNMARAPIRRLRFIHSFAQRPAKLVLVEAVREGRATLEIAPPLVVHGSDGGFTPEAERLLQTFDAAL